MKTILKTLSVLLAASLMAVAQEIPRPLPKNGLTISGAYTVVGSSTSNLTSSLLIPVGINGVGFYVRLAGTNAATTTNATILLEQVIVTATATNAVDSHTFGLSIPQNGTTGHDVYTNIQATAANFGNAPWLRVKSIQNTNLASIFISNFVAYIRE